MKRIVSGNTGQQRDSTNDVRAHHQQSSNFHKRTPLNECRMERRINTHEAHLPDAVWIRNGFTTGQNDTILHVHRSRDVNGWRANGVTGFKSHKLAKQTRRVFSRMPAKTKSKGRGKGWGKGRSCREPSTSSGGEEEMPHVQQESQQIETQLPSQAEGHGDGQQIPQVIEEGEDTGPGEGGSRPDTPVSQASQPSREWGSPEEKEVMPS